jgi:glutamate-5-semialdehyde dehydrogenase
MAVSPTPLPPEATVPEPSPELLARAAAVRRAAMGLAQTSDEERRSDVEEFDPVSREIT